MRTGAMLAFLAMAVWGVNFAVEHIPPTTGIAVSLSMATVAGITTLVFLRRCKSG